MPFLVKIIALSGFVPFFIFSHYFLSFRTDHNPMTIYIALIAYISLLNFLFQFSQASKLRKGLPTTVIKKGQVTKKGEQNDISKENSR